MSNYVNRHEAHTCLGGDIDFIIDGVPAINFGLHYAPENSQYVTNKPADRNVNIQDLSSTSGGSIFYGSTLRAKEFTLRSWYWIDDVKSGFLFDLNNHFSVGKKHTLYFTEEPWIEYEIIITKTNNEPYTMISGLYSITCTACSGVGKYRNPNLTTGTMYDNFINNSGYFREVTESQYPTKTRTVSAQTEFTLYNPGAAETPVMITMTGSNLKGFSIYNKTNNKLVEFRAFDTSTFTSPYSKLVNDAATGKTYMANTYGNYTKAAFLYHYSGLLTLAASDKTDVGTLTYVSGSGTTHTFTCEVPLYENSVGKYIAFEYNGSAYWFKINAVSYDGTKTTITATSDSSVSITSGSTNADTKIVVMNELIITPTTTMNINFTFDYTPRF